MKLIHVFTVFGTAESFFDGQFKYLADQDYEIILMSSDSPKASAFAERNNIRFIPVNIPRSLSPKSIINAVGQIRMVIKQECPDAVLGHTPVGALVAMLAAKLEHVRNRIYYRHGLIYTTMSGIKKVIFKMEEQFVAAMATKIVNVSHSLSRLAVQEHLNSDKKQRVIGAGTCGGIDAINLFNPQLLDAERVVSMRQQYGLSDVDMTFGFCGRICKDKGVPELVEAFYKFQERYSNIKSKLILVGRFDDRDAVTADTKQKIENNQDIICCGLVSKQDLPYYYAMMDVFVFPSYREGFGMCVLEASAMEKPILVSHAHGCEDSIIENQTGYYIPISPEGICEGMKEMIDADTRIALGEAGRTMVEERFDSEQMWPLIDTLYQQIIK